MKAFSRKVMLALVCGGVLVAFFAILRFDERELLKGFCDAFSLAGVTLLCGAGLSFVRFQGGFTGIGYLLKWAKDALFPFGVKEKRSYGDWRQKENEKEKVSVLPFVLAGLFYLSVACVLLFFYSA